MSYCAGDHLYCPQGRYRGRVVEVRDTHVHIQRPGLVGLMVIKAEQLACEGWKHRDVSDTLVGQIEEKT